MTSSLMESSNPRIHCNFWLARVQQKELGWGKVHHALTETPRPLLWKNKESMHAMLPTPVCSLSPAAMAEWRMSNRWHSSLARRNAWLILNTGRQLRMENQSKGSPHCHLSLCLTRWCLRLAVPSTLSASAPSLVSVSIVLMNSSRSAETTEAELWKDHPSQLRRCIFTGVTLQKPCEFLAVPLLSP